MTKLMKGCALAALLAIGALVPASPGAARPTYPAELDRRCTLEGRTPPNPAALARAGAALGDCALCHTGRSPSGNNATPDAFAFLSNNLDPFCLASVANRAPVLDPVGSRQVDVAVPLLISLHATDPDSDALTLTAAPVPTGAVFSDAGDGTATFAWTPTAGQVGSHTVAFTASDGVLVDMESIVVSVGPVDAPPLLDPIGDQLVDLGSPLALAFAATDPEVGPLTFSAEGLPAGATFVDGGDGTASLTWLADMLGRHPVTVTVFDSATPPGSASEAFVITVVDPNATGPEIAEARWRARGLKLKVRGDGAPPNGLVEILDASSGVPLGVRRANADGGFGGSLRPFLAPCEVQASADGAPGAVVPVADAPADCGQPLTRIRRAEWSCETGELRLNGERAPVGGSVRVLDPDQSGLVLGEATPDRKGRFRARIALGSQPARVQLGVLAGGGAWELEPMPVASRHACGSGGGADDDEDGTGTGLDDGGVSAGGGDDRVAPDGGTGGDPGTVEDDPEDPPQGGADDDHDDDDEAEDPEDD